MLVVVLLVVSAVPWSGAQSTIFWPLLPAGLIIGAAVYLAKQFFRKDDEVKKPD